MDIKASLNYLRIAPRKVRLVTRLILGMDVQKAERELQTLNKRASLPVLKLLNSAIANAEKNFGLDEKRKKSLYIKKIVVDEGPKLKRWTPVSRGTAHQIQKKTSHVSIILEEQDKPQKKEGRKEVRQKRIKSKK